MSEHHAGVSWKRTSADMTYDTYNRTHEVLFNDGTIVLPGSAAPGFLGDADRVDPEEAFVGALSSCHMLTFLAICSRQRLIVDTYEDSAVGHLEKGPDGRLWVTRVTLKPHVKFAPGIDVDVATLTEIHHKSHEGCFVANSVKTAVTVEPRL